MNSQFEIVQSSLSFTDRPPISYKVREYLERYIIDTLLKPKKIVVATDWQIHLVLTFCPEAPRYKADDIFIPKTPRILKNERVKIYEALIPKKVIDQSSQPFLRTIEIIWAAITMFFTRTYKKVTQADMATLWQNIDLKYLLSLPYPAPMTEQKYLTDIITPEGNVKDAIQWSESKSFKTHKK
jgi:hypothetical protein